MTLSLCLPAASFLTGAVIPGGRRADGAKRMMRPRASHVPAADVQHRAMVRGT